MQRLLYSAGQGGYLKKDITTKDLLSNCDVFADIANVNLFGGEQLISPEDLMAVPLESSYKDMDGKHHRLFRDTFMQVKKLGGCIAFIGFEIRLPQSHWL